MLVVMRRLLPVVPPGVGSHRSRVRGGKADDGREWEILAVVSGEMVVMRRLMGLAWLMLAVVK